MDFVILNGSDSFTEFWWPLYQYISYIGFPFMIYVFFKVSASHSRTEKELISEKYKIERELKSQKDKSLILSINNSNLKKCIDEKDVLYKNIQKIDNTAIKTIASLYSDFVTIQYEISEKYLKRKSHPAYKEATRITELKKETKQYIVQFKEIQYRYEALLNLFPELSKYIEDFDSIKNLTNNEGLDVLVENYDRSRDFLSKEEYERLSVDERNQLALNKYIIGKKSNWQIGRDYEMFCASELRCVKYKVIEFGIEKRLEDMGRDLIATDPSGDLFVIQCKYWSSDKLIHEKHIAQLYGTTIMFELENKYFDKKIYPVIMTNITLSETAKNFANRLGVIIADKRPFREFSRIKCNINDGNKIYHLPFDQQYDRTKIENDGEFYATTVKEAVSMGFRRAFRHLGN